MFYEKISVYSIYSTKKILRKILTKNLLKNHMKKFVACSKFFKFWLRFLVAVGWATVAGKVQQIPVFPIWNIEFYFSKVEILNSSFKTRIQYFDFGKVEFNISTLKVEILNSSFKTKIQYFDFGKVEFNISNWENCNLLNQFPATVLRSWM